MESDQTTHPTAESLKDLQNAQAFRRRFERTLFQIPEDDFYAIYQHLHHTVAELASVDAFYVCLYSPEDDSLYFAYNYDCGLHDEPVNVPMGQGPTSYVVRERKPFVYRGEGISLQNAGMPFGDTERPSRSAIHLPLWIWTAEGEQVLGVVSAQSYQEQAFDTDFLIYFTMIADRTAYELKRRMQSGALAEANLLALRRVEAAAEHTRLKLDASVAKLMRTLKDALKQAEALRPLVAAADTNLSARVNDLCRACHRAQTEATQIPLQFRPIAAPTATTAEVSVGMATAGVPSAPPSTDYALSLRESEVASLLAEGLSNATIAERLHISPDTVKFHVTGILRKLDVKNRTEAAAILIAAKQGKPTQTGR